jgi:hypothetical protein
MDQQTWANVDDYFADSLLDDDPVLHAALEASTLRAFLLATSRRLAHRGTPIVSTTWSATVR